jgi:peptide/nickel transport system permease protein
MSFQRYILRRLLFIIPVLFGITFVAFFIANAVPADPLNANLPQSALNDPDITEAFRRRWGLDRPPLERYLTYLGNLLQGDLGTSIRTRQPVLDDIRKFLPATIELATFSIVIGVGLGVGLGMLSALYRNTLIDYVSRVFSLIGVSFPVFLLALIALNVFYVQLGLTAGPGRLDVVLQARAPQTVTGFYTVDAIIQGNWRIFSNAIAHLVLPSFVLGCYVSGIIARITRSSLLEVLGQDYIRTARSKGLRERLVLRRHAMRNALIPVVTVIGLSYGNLLSGAVLTERIFSWPGIGTYMFRASTSQDFPAIMGVSLLFAVIFVGVNFVVDILYYFIDPRIRIA